MTRYLTAAESAKAIRIELKETFPATKFSVRTSRGGSIHIEWTDGPSSAAVEAITTKFDGKGFDGMIDLQYYINGWMLDGKIIGTRCEGTLGSLGVVAPWGQIPPHDDAELVHLGAGYINHRRNVSAAFARRLITQIATYWGGVTYTPEVRDSKWGHYEMVNESDYYRNVRDDLRLEWRDAIHRASQDATMYRQEASV